MQAIMIRIPSLSVLHLEKALVAESLRARQRRRRDRPSHVIPSTHTNHYCFFLESSEEPGWPRFQALTTQLWVLST